MTVPPQRILVGIDGSPVSLQASRLTVALAASWGSAVRGVAVLGDERAERLIDQAAGGGLPARERRQLALEVALTHLTQSAQAAGVEADTVLRVRASAEPYEVILEEAEEWQADLLVVGRGSRRGIGRALLGSQTEHVLEFATVPVIVVPGRQP